MCCFHNTMQLIWCLVLDDGSEPSSPRLSGECLLPDEPIQGHHLEARPGIEPGTIGLTNHRSAAELPSQIFSHVFPRLSVSYLPYDLRINPKFSGHFSYHSTAMGSVINVGHLFLGQFGPSVDRAFGTSIFTDSVLDVVAGSTKPQMGWIYTSRIVTSVTNNTVYFPVVKKVRYTLRVLSYVLLSRTYAHMPVAPIIL